MNKLFFRDCVVVFTVMIVLWIVLIFVMVSVSSIVPDQLERLGIVVAGIGAGAFATAASTALLVHLKKNQEHLYLQELLCLESNHQNH